MGSISVLIICFFVEKRLPEELYISEFLQTWTPRCQKSENFASRTSRGWKVQLHQLCSKCFKRQSCYFSSNDATSGSSFTRKVWKLCKLFVDSKEQLKQIHTAIDLLSFVGQCRHHSARTKEFRADDVHVNLPKSFKKWWITYPWKQHKINLTCVHICINRNTLLYREIEIEEYTYFPLKPSLVNPWLFRCCSKYTFILLPCW